MFASTCYLHVNCVATEILIAYSIQCSNYNGLKFTASSTGEQNDFVAGKMMIYPNVVERFTTCGINNRIPIKQLLYV